MLSAARIPQLRRVQLWTLFFICGLLLSGTTAIPLATEFACVTRLLGQDMSLHGILPAGAAQWLRSVQGGILLAEQKAPFLFYGTDWLAFGHFVIAVAFLGALRDPVRNRWLYQFGMIACAAVLPWALLLGEMRGIPFWWRMVDASFGVFGFIPVWLCHRWTHDLERSASANITSFAVSATIVS